MDAPSIDQPIDLQKLQCLLKVDNTVDFLQGLFGFHPCGVFKVDDHLFVEICGDWILIHPGTITAIEELLGCTMNLASNPSYPGDVQLKCPEPHFSVLLSAVKQTAPQITGCLNG